MGSRKMFRNLTVDDKNIIRLAYQDTNLSRDAIQGKLSKYFGVKKRAIRLWAKELELGVMKQNITRSEKILIYDIETSRVEFKSFWTGKQFLGFGQARQEPRIISVAWKWLGEEEILHLTWDKNHNDRELLEKFLEVYNSADMVVGFNNNNFDNRWINARAMKYDLFVNIFVKSFDIMKEMKRFARVLSYSMSYLSRYNSVTVKQSNEGIFMWDMIEDGTPEQQAEYLDKMIEYNRGDVVTTEELFLKLRKYMGYQMHLGVFNGEEKYSCPNCGSTNVELFKTTFTKAGTVQHIMKCKDGEMQYKISNRDYMRFLDDKFKEII